LNDGNKFNLLKDPSSNVVKSLYEDKDVKENDDLVGIIIFFKHSV
jgi:hypothetical protein